MESFNMAEGLMRVYFQPPRPTPRDYEFLDGLNRITGNKNITSVFLLGMVQMWLVDLQREYDSQNISKQ